MGSRPMEGSRESRGRRTEAEDEQTGVQRLEETLELKVIEVSGKVSGWEGLNGGLGGVLIGWCVDIDGNSEALWVTCDIFGCNL